jgi:hypothetical protein
MVSMNPSMKWMGSTRDEVELDFFIFNIAKIIDYNFEKQEDNT